MSQATKRLRTSDDDEEEEQDSFENLAAAAAQGLVASLRTLLDIKTSPNVSPHNSDDYTPLMLASYHGHSPAAQLLLEAKADVDHCSGNSKWTALMFAATKNQIREVKILLEAKASIDVQGNDGYTALILAAQKGHDAAVKLLLKFQAPVDTKDATQRSALCWAASEGHLAVVKMLLRAKAPLDSESASPLMFAAYKGHLEIAKTLMSAEKRSAPRCFGHAAMTEATKNGLVDMMKILLEAKISLTLRPGYFDSLVQLAVAQGHTTAVETLLAQMAPRCRSYFYLEKAHNTAAEHGDLPMLKLLLGHPKCRAFPYERKYVNYALRLATTKGHYLYVNELLNAGASVNTGLDGNSLLMIATRNGHLNLVELLLQRGALVNARNQSRDTALIIAARCGYASIVQTLLEAKAHMATNSLGEDVWWAAVNGSHESIMRELHRRSIGKSLDATLARVAEKNNTSSAKILLEMRAEATASTKQTRVTALMSAAMNNNTELMKLLIQGKAHINMINKDGETALDVAARNRRLDAVKVLLEAGADATICRHNGRTVLMELAIINRHDLIRYLLTASLLRVK